MTAVSRNPPRYRYRDSTGETGWGGSAVDGARIFNVTARGRQPPDGVPGVAPRVSR